MMRTWVGWILCLGLVSFQTVHADFGIRLINGKPVAPGTFKEVIKITTNGATCTATVVGPRVIVTAAHCATNDALSTFTIDGVQHSAKMTRSTLYPTKDHDIALGYTSMDINAKPVTWGGKTTVGLGLTLLGYGCTNPGGTGGSDGILRIGDTVVTSFSDLDMISRRPDGAALCFGDSGGPALTNDGGTQKLLIGVNSKGNLKDTNWTTRLDNPDSIQFAKSFVATHSVDICGISLECGTPPPTAPTCTLAAAPKTIKLGQSLTLRLLVEGQATAATIEGQNVSLANPSISLTPTSKGMFTARGTVTGPGGSNSCQDTYQVQDDPITPEAPTCTLAAVPSTVKIGEMVSLEISISGKADKADIDGTPVSIPFGKKVVTPSQKGTFNAKANVSGPGGSNSCWTSYTAEEGSGPGPNTPALAVVPTYCGENTLPTQVRKVCLNVIKRDVKFPDLRLTDAISITYQDQSREVLPIISRRGQAKGPGELGTIENLTLYANTTVPVDQYFILDSREAKLTLLPSRRQLSRRGGDVPAAIEGRSAKGQYFIVEKLQPYAVNQ